jgi:hypothetical protein
MSSCYIHPVVCTFCDFWRKFLISVNFIKTCNRPLSENKLDLISTFPLSREYKCWHGAFWGWANWRGAAIFEKRPGTYRFLFTKQRLVEHNSEFFVTEQVNCMAYVVWDPPTRRFHFERPSSLRPFSVPKSKSTSHYDSQSASQSWCQVPI